MLVMRRRAPDIPRTFRAPAATLVGTIGIVGCVYLFFSLPTQTQLYFVAWNAIGLLVYFGYARRRAGVQAASFLKT